MYQFLRRKLKSGSFPMYIAAGGSSPLGVVAFVNAALELREQIRDGQIPEPDRIYVALGTAGTAAGLLLGLKAANLKSQVICVLVADPRFSNSRRISRLFHRTSSYLNSLDPSFPRFKLTKADIHIRHDFYGRGYAFFTEEGMEAVRCIANREGIQLDGTYTGKTLAALIADSRKKSLTDKVYLFWNTYNSRDFSDTIAGTDYSNLPLCFHRYFEEDVQSLDRHA